jgi:hypothetical protein
MLLSIFKVLVTLLSILLISLIGYSLYKKSNDQKEKLPRVIHIEQMTLPPAKKSENDEVILSHLKQYIDKNKKYADSIQTNENKILKELKIFTAKNVSQDEIIKSIKEEGLLIKKEIQTLSANFDKKIDKEVKKLKKDIKNNSNKINKKIATVNKKTIEKIQKKIEESNNNAIISPAYVLDENEKSLAYGEIETIATSNVYKIEEEGPIRNPIDISVEEENSIDELNFVQTLGVVNVSEPYLSTDDVM